MNRVESRFIVHFCHVICMSSLICRSFKHLCKLSGIIQLLASLSLQYDTSPLLRPLLNRMLPAAIEHGDSASYSSTEESEDELSEAKPHYRGLLEGLLTEVALERNMADTVARWVCRHQNF